MADRPCPPFVLRPTELPPGAHVEGAATFLVGLITDGPRAGRYIVLHDVEPTPGDFVAVTLRAPADSGPTLDVNVLAPA